MVTIPPGTFKLGSPQSDVGVYTNEGPQHQVTISHAFAVGVHDVTFDQWDLCFSGGGCEGYRPSDHGWGRGKRPVINISRDEALSYIRWINEKVRALQPPPDGIVEAGPYRLLTEAEWEYAARAGTTTAYFWGESHGTGNANCDGCGSQWDNQQTAPVGSFKPNAFGLYDMAGNVLQWVEDCYHENYIHAPANGSAWVTGTCPTRVLRGGSWYNSTYYLRSANRFSDGPDFHGVNVGFRVARSLN